MLSNQTKVALVLTEVLRDVESERYRLAVEVASLKKEIEKKDKMIEDLRKAGGDE